MTIDEFADITREVIDERGFDAFCTSACLPDQRQIRALTGVPSHVDQEVAALEWVAEIAAPGEEVLVAFKVSATQFKIIRKMGAAQESQIYSVGGR